MITVLRIGICFLPVFIVFLLSRRFVPAFQPFKGFIAVLSGLLAVVPVVLIQQGIGQLFLLSGVAASYFFTCFVSSSLVEESAKAGVLAAVFRKKVSFTVFCSAAMLAGLSFGGFEAVIYLFSGRGNTLLRLFTAVILHGFCTILSGFTVWMLNNDKSRKGESLRCRLSQAFPFVFAVFVHGLYNFFAGMSGGLWWFSLVCIVIAINQCVIYYRKLKSENTLPE
jgi:RsiW-degrading membrane proteinase PrsW (M82 family)